jgi:hypothetical protein
MTFFVYFIDVSQPDTGHFTVACKRIVKFVTSQEFTYLLDDIVLLSAMHHATFAVFGGVIAKLTLPSPVVQLLRLEVGNVIASFRRLFIDRNSRHFVVVIHQRSTKNKKRKKYEIAQSKETRANQKIGIFNK